MLDNQGLIVEEPIAYDNLAGYTQLARELKTPVQLGENFYGPRSLFRAIQETAGDYVMLDLMRIGGVTGWLRAAGIAGAAGIEVSTHLYPKVAAHLMRVTETAHWLEWQDWANPILAEPFRLEDGHLLIPDRPGNGIEWDEDAIERYPLRRLRSEPLPPSRLDTPAVTRGLRRSRNQPLPRGSKRPIARRSVRVSLPKSTYI
jgi:mandelate racemase